MTARLRPGGLLFSRGSRSEAAGHGYGGSVTIEHPLVPFEGEALMVWSHAGAHPLVLAAIHHAAAVDGPVIELVMVGMASGRRPQMVRRVVAASGPGTEPAALKWFAQDRLREVHWEEDGLRVWAGIGRRSVPARVPGWLLGERGRGRPSLPTRTFLAQVEVVVPEGSQLATFAGRRHGLLFSTARLATDPPRLRRPRPKRAEAAPEPS